MLDEVQDKVGEKIAALCRTEAATVTAGCWSALVLGTAGVLTGMDVKKVAMLPNVEGLPKNEVIVQKGHNHGYIHALTNTGIKPVVVETLEELEKAIHEKTALMYFLNESSPKGQIQHKEWLEVAKKHNIPTIIDIAADIPLLKTYGSIPTWVSTSPAFRVARHFAARRAPACSWVEKT
jgi:L-seryl-tRNA(Ser) seleniumtransferase